LEFDLQCLPVFSPWTVSWPSCLPGRTIFFARNLWTPRYWFQWFTFYWSLPANLIHFLTLCCIFWRNFINVLHLPLHYHTVWTCVSWSSHPHARHGWFETFRVANKTSRRVRAIGITSAVFFKIVHRSSSSVSKRSRKSVYHPLLISAQAPSTTLRRRKRSGNAIWRKVILITVGLNLAYY
jgi:hypothetical protein